MVKFSKQFEGQIVPEWKEAFVDYCQLKKDLKKINLLNPQNYPNNNNHNTSLSNTLFSSIRNFSSFGYRRREHGLIQVYIHFILKNFFLIFFFFFQMRVTELIMSCCY